MNVGDYFILDDYGFYIIRYNGKERKGEVIKWFDILYASNELVQYNPIRQFGLQRLAQSKLKLITKEQAEELVLRRV